MNTAEYRVVHYLVEPILDWLRKHPQDPVAALEEAIDAIEDPAGWQMMVNALDSTEPPETPPFT